MGKWEMVRLGDVCNLNMGQSPASSSYNENGEGLPFYQGNADFGELHPIIRYHCSEPKKIALPNDILLSVRAPIGALNIANEECCIGRGLAALTPYENLEMKYLYYILKDNHAELNAKGTGSTFKAINKSNLKDFEIPLPPLETQQKIAATLDTAAALLKLRQQQLAELDLLVKSRFIEMFGDPYTNEKGWKIEKLGNLTTKVTDGVHAKPNYTTTGKPFISVVNITKGYVDFTKCKYVSAEDYSKMIKSTHPEKNDILYTKVGATYGIPAYIDTDEDFCLYVSVCLIKPNHEKIDSRFLAISMSMPYVKMQADRRIRGIGVPDLHLNQIREFDIVCPHPEMQSKFVSFVQQVDKLQLEMQKSLDEMNTLFNSLMQKYFE